MRPTLYGYEKDYVFIWNRLSLNGMMHFRINSIIKSCELDKKDNIISFRAMSYIYVVVVCFNFDYSESNQ